MKREIIALSLLISLSGFAYAATEQAAQLDAQNTQTIDELVTKMNQASNQNKFHYMNEIKERISSEKSQDRESRMDDALRNQEQEREHEQSSMEQEHEQEMEQEHTNNMNYNSESHDSNDDSGDHGGDGNGGDGNGGDGNGGDNDGGDHGDGGHD